MLRRRILASAMASVMAIGSVAVVASAEETATAQVKSKDDLAAYVKTFDKFREDGVYDYGATAGENFIKVIEFCDNVVADPTATSQDATVAYMMLENVYASMKLRTSAELQTLLNTCKKDYETDNMLNNETTDEIYTADSFRDFKGKYQYAESVIGSSDSRLLTDAYDDLEAAYKGLNPLTQVTKADFRAVLKQYESIFTKANQYDSWRRGTLSGWIDNDYTKHFGDLQKTVKDNVTTFGDICSVVFKTGASMDGSVVVFAGANGDVRDYINTQYKAFDEQKTVNKSTNTSLIAAYQVAKDAVAIFNGFTADDTNRANISSVKKLLNDYNTQLVTDFNTTGADAVYKYLMGATATLPANFQTTARVMGVVAKETPDYKVLAGNYAQGTDVRKFVKVYSSLDSIVNPDPNKLPAYKLAVVPDLKDALYAAEQYLAGNYSNTVFTLDKSGTVTTGNGSPAEWAIVYRKLKYALEDLYPAASAQHTRAEVVALIEDCYDLADKTGDASLFHVEHNALVTARQKALDWVRAANTDKTYKDGKTYLYDGVLTSSDGVYLDLEAKYKALNNYYLAYQYSFGDIYNKLAEVAEKIDAGDLKATEKLIDSMNTTAYRLATLKNNHPSPWWNGMLHTDNDVFSATAEFNDFNRLHTGNGNWSQPDPNTVEAELRDSYEALLAEVKAQEEPDVIKGDLDKSGAVDQKDAAIILKMVASGETIDVAVGDYDGDGYADQRDAAAILKYVTTLA